MTWADTTSWRGYGGLALLLGHNAESLDQLNIFDGSLFFQAPFSLRLENEMAPGGNLEQISAWLASHQITAPIEFNTEKPTRDGSQWFIAKKFEVNGKEYVKAWAGDYKRGLKTEWTSNHKMTKAEMEEAKTHLDDLLAKEKAERTAYEETVADQVYEEWKTFETSGRTPYMERKQIAELYGARLKNNSGYDKILACPARDSGGDLWNFQRIYSQKLSAGDKFFVDGARLEGLFFVLKGHERLEKATKVFIAEGFATAASVQEAMGGEAVVVAAFNAGNLTLVGTSLRQLLPFAQIVFCADNDAYTAIEGKPYNVGLEKARRAAGACKGTVVWPIFKYPQLGLTDFNDLHCAQGLSMVKDQIENHSQYLTEIAPLIPEVTETGVVKKLGEGAVVKAILNYYGENLIKHEEELFLYTGTHWREFRVADYDHLKKQISIAGNGLSSKDVGGAFKALMYTIPHAQGVDLYKPNPYAANFLNGTLHADMVGGKYQLNFRPHSRKDFLTHVLPFDMPEWRRGGVLPPAPKFQGMIDRLWSENPDKEQVHLLAEELIGACLMPAFPVIAFFFGAPNSGKSTFIKLLVKLVSIENTCQVQLCDLKGFNLETMIGKLVNFDTDIDTIRPINDSATKKLIDRSPMKVHRKGRTDIYGFVPAVHLFAGNNLPVSMDGSSRAYERRMIFVKTSAAMEGRQAYDFEQQILTEEMPALLARGLNGLSRLLDQGGLYTVPETSSIHVKEMESFSDIVAQFLDDVAHGEVEIEKGHALKAGADVKVARPVLWECFRNWQDSSFPDRKPLGKKTFFANLETKGFRVKTVEGIRMFSGLNLGVKSDSIM